jgi:hypothetical protein
MLLCGLYLLLGYIRVMLAENLEMLLLKVSALHDSMDVPTQLEVFSDGNIHDASEAFLASRAAIKEWLWNMWIEEFEGVIWNHSARRELIDLTQKMLVIFSNFAWK